MGLIDRTRSRHPFTSLAADTLYTNLRAIHWAIPLADRGIEQVRHKETISRITDAVLEEMTDWAGRPLADVYAAVFVHAVG